MRIVYHDFQSTFKELLLNDKSLNIPHQNIQRLYMETQKALDITSTNIYGNLFIRNNHNLSLRSKPELKISSIRVN